eukprot:15474909-Alexandrium_andersonii.AAC.1
MAASAQGQSARGVGNPGAPPHCPTARWVREGGAALLRGPGGPPPGGRRTQRNRRCLGAHADP